MVNGANTMVSTSEITVTMANKMVSFAPPMVCKVLTKMFLTSGRALPIQVGLFLEFQHARIINNSRNSTSKPVDQPQLNGIGALESFASEPFSVNPDMRPARLHPINLPATIRDASPDQRPERSSLAMMIQDGSSLIKPASMKGIGKTQPLDIQMVTELMAKRVEQSSK
jgi:hypothetical protein